MSKLTMSKKVLYLLLALGGIMFLPYLGAWIHYGGQLPEDFFKYPMIEPIAKAPFNKIIFGIISVFFVGTFALYLFPRLFGFKKPDFKPVKSIKKVSFPYWFWVGLLLWAGTLALLFARVSEPRWLLHWSDLPIFWGFTLLLDGIVYKRKGGESIIATVPREMVGIAVASIGGWMIFEYLNFFVDDNWYYPRGNIIPQNEFLLYAIVGSSGLMPMAFEWYSLLKTFKGMKNRFDHGIKVTLPGWLKTVLLFLGFGGMFASGLFPNGVFFALWVSPLVIIAVLLDRFDIWTPFKPVKDGNWTPLLLFALTYFLQGITMEGWNYFSAFHGDDGIFTYAPAYWAYSIPYVGEPKLFEMPILGYLGYLPFGVYCWIWWIMFAFLQDIPSKLAKLEAEGN
jgi:hypothetical protein